MYMGVFLQVSAECKSPYKTGSVDTDLKVWLLLFCSTLNGRVSEGSLGARPGLAHALAGHVQTVTIICLFCVVVMGGDLLSRSLAAPGFTWFAPGHLRQLHHHCHSAMVSAVLARTGCDSAELIAFMLGQSTASLYMFCFMGS
jgi:hypothetical protein